MEAFLAFGLAVEFLPLMYGHANSTIQTTRLLPSVVEGVLGGNLGKYGILTPLDPGNRGNAARYVDCAWLQVSKHDVYVP